MLHSLTRPSVITALSLLLFIGEITSSTTTHHGLGNNIPVGKLSVNAKQAKIIENFINWKVDPCDDFFAYACSNWTIYHNHTQRYTEASGFVDHKINKKLVQFLENYQPAGKATRVKNQERKVFDDVFRKMRTYYRSCKHAQELELLEYLKLVQAKEKLNLAELLECCSDLSFGDWWLVLARLRRYGFKGVILEHSVVPKFENSDAYIIELDQANADLKLPRRQQVMTYFELLELNRTEAALKYRAMKQFEVKLRDLLEVEDEYGLLELSLDNLKAEFPDVNWREYFYIVLGRNCTGYFAIQLRNLVYFVQVFDLLKVTEKEVFCNFIVIMFLDYLQEDGTSSFEKIDCIVDLRSKMDMAVNYLYKERFYKAQGSTNERDTLILLKALQYEFLQLLKENPLQLSEKEKKFLREKAAAIGINFGNLPSNKQNRTTFVKQYYRNLRLDPKNYYKNHLTLLALRCQHEHMQLWKQSIDDNFVFITESSTAHSSNPYYLLRRNVIIVPYGIYQPPIYHKNMHAVLKFSIFGFLLAHELAHAFDESGLNFDGHGKLHDIGSQIIENGRLNKSIECLQQREQTASIDERIADIVGIRLAYNAYFGGAIAIDPTVKVGFSAFPIRRLFFLNLAQYFCGSMQAEFLYHDSDNIRLRHLFMNFAPFAEEFQCQLGDEMYPAKECRLW